MGRQTIGQAALSGARRGRKPWSYARVGEHPGKRKKQGIGPAPSFAGIAVACLVLAGLVFGHFYHKNAAQAREDATERLSREIFECDPAEVWQKAEADYRTAAAVNSLEDTRGTDERAVERKTRVADGPETHRAERREAAVAKTAEDRADRKARRQNAVPRAPVETAQAAPVRLMRVIHSDHDARLNGIMDQMN